MILKLLELLGRKRIITDNEGDEYMHRYYLIHKEKLNAFEEVKPWPNIYIHRILKSDPDRDPHDHPWNYCTIILTGGYYEWVPTKVPSGRTIEKRKWRRPGTILWRRANSFHRLELIQPVTTIFIHGRRFREWGFLTKAGWIDRMTYFKQKLGP